MLQAILGAALLATSAVPAALPSPLVKRALPWPPIAVAEKVSPSVVGITNLHGSPDGPLVARGSGSGVVVRQDGYIVTNDHVVRGATKLQVHLQDGRTMPAQLIGEDPLTDLAVIRVRAGGLTAATFATPKEVRVGEIAIAIGNPMGLGFARTVTVGVVSGIDRSLGAGYALRAYGLIQTDAAINPGNSGGPLCDAEGRVIGINSVKVTATGFESMGFAIPSELVQQITGEIITHGKVSRPWLGIGVGASGRVHDGEHLVAGVQIGGVVANGPGDRAGLKEQDVITAIDGRPVPDLVQFYRQLGQHRVGQQVCLHVQRDGRAFDVQVRLQEMPQGLLRNLP